MAEELRRGALLRNGTYRIEEKLGQGGFGITYLARDLSLDRPVAVKEFFLENCCGREDSTGSVTTAGTQARETFSRYKVKFLKEARNIAKLNHPGIIKIHAAFEENGTAYYVMEYINGMSLDGMVRKGGSLSASRALEYIKGVGDALSYVHAHSMTHLDVKPANIMVRSEDNSPILIDFGLSKQYDTAGQQTSTTPPGISHGYAPLEQYIAGGVSKFSPQTDIYSLAATLYYLLSGETPQQAPHLVQDGLHFPASIPMQFRAAISRAMSSNPTQRRATVAAFLADLNPSQPRPKPNPNPKPDPRPNPNPDAPTVIDYLQQQRRQHPAQRSLSKQQNCGLYYDESTSEIVYGTHRYKMVYVAGGSFAMGAKKTLFGKKGGHQVTLSSYSIGQTEVPQWLWVAVMGSNPSNWKGDNLPVEQVSWNDCQAFLSKLSARTGKNFRLPTEAQWEYAARGGNRSRGYQYSGSDNLGAVAWYGGNSGQHTHEVGTKRANELGLYDMSGNVWELCSDWYGDYPDNSVSDPEGAASGSYRVNRGGCWYNSPRYCRVANRSYSTPDGSSLDLGFRLAL